MLDPDRSTSPVPSAERQTRKRRVLRRLWMFLAVVLVLAAVGAGLIGMALRERKPSLLSQATRVLDMKNYQEYVWKSDHEIIGTCCCIGAYLPSESTESAPRVFRMCMSVVWTATTCG